MRLNWLDLMDDEIRGNKRWAHWNVGQSSTFNDKWEKPGSYIYWSDPDGEGTVNSVTGSVDNPPDIDLGIRGVHQKVNGEKYCSYHGLINAYDCLRHYITVEFRQ